MNFKMIKSEKILITGCNGFVGRHLVSQLSNSSSSSFVCASRDTHEKSPQFIQVGSIGPYTDWTEALKDVTHIVHLAGRAHMMREKTADRALYAMTNTAGTLRLAEQAANAGVKRLVFISTIKVCGDGTLSPQMHGYNETDIAGCLHEDPYALSKYNAEVGLTKIAENTELEFCILRPPLIYGPGVKGNLLSLTKAIGRGYPLPFGDARNNQRSMISVFNLIDAILAALYHPNAKNEIFNIADAEAVSTKELVEIIAEAMHVKPKLVRIPQDVCRIAAGVTGKVPLYNRIFGNLKVDSRKINNKLGWMPPGRLAEELRISFAAKGTK